MIDHQNTIIVIPARMASTRLPGKPLADINGVPMIVHVWRRAVEAKLGHVLVAPAESEIAAAIRARWWRCHCHAFRTYNRDLTGWQLPWRCVTLTNAFSHVVNLQGDLPTIDPLAVRRCLAGLTNETVDISTIAAEIRR